MTIEQGLDIAKFEGFRSWLKENPDKGILGLESTVIYEGTVGRSIAHIGAYRLDDKVIDRPTRKYTIPYGAWKEVEETGGVVGPTDRLEPVEMTLASLGACLNVAVSYNAAREGIKLEGLETKVEADVDPRGLFAIKDDLPSCLRTVRYTIKAKGNLTEEQLKKLESFAVRSPVHGFISNPVPTVGKVVKG
jgi:uncharacterized OsmC-like protein